MTPAASLRRVQWAVRAALTLGVAASVTANILHAQPNPIAQAIAAWPPLALLITVELVSRIPIHRRLLGALRITATAAIAGIAAWVSYHHMVGVVARYGETGTVPYLLPLSVDGLIIVASVSLIELASRIRDFTTPPPAQPTPAALAPTLPAPGSPTSRPPVRTPLPVPAPRPPQAATTTPIRPPLRTDPPTTTPPAHRPLQTDNKPDGRQPGQPPPRPSPPATSASMPSPPPPPRPTSPNLAPDVVPLLPAARTARDQLTRQGQPVSRDALAARLRANGHSIRNNRVTELLAALKAETSTVNGTKPTPRI